MILNLEFYAIYYYDWFNGAVGNILVNCNCSRSNLPNMPMTSHTPYFTKCNYYIILVYNNIIVN